MGSSSQLLAKLLLITALIFSELAAAGHNDCTQTNDPAIHSVQLAALLSSFTISASHVHPRYNSDSISIVTGEEKSACQQAVLNSYKHQNIRRQRLSTRIPFSFQEKNQVQGIIQLGGNQSTEAQKPASSSAHGRQGSSNSHSGRGDTPNRQKQPGRLYPTHGEGSEDPDIETLPDAPFGYTIKIHQTEYRISKQQVLGNLNIPVSQAPFLLNCMDCQQGDIPLVNMALHAEREDHKLVCPLCQQFKPEPGTVNARQRMLQSHVQSDCRQYRGEVAVPPFVDESLTVLRFIFRFGSEETRLDLLQQFDLPVTAEHLQQADRYRKTLLHDLAQYASKSVIFAFIKRFKASINQELLQLQDSYGSTPLHYLFQAQPEDLILEVIKEMRQLMTNRLLSLQNQSGSTLMHILYHKGFIQAVRNIFRQSLRIDDAHLKLKTLKLQDYSGINFLHILFSCKDSRLIYDFIDEQQILEPLASLSPEPSAPSESLLERPEPTQQKAGKETKNTGATAYMECPRCNESMDDGCSLTPCCDQIFHRECIKKWVGANKKPCSHCRGFLDINLLRNVKAPLIVVKGGHAPEFINTLPVGKPDEARTSPANKPVTHFDTKSASQRIAPTGYDGLRKAVANSDVATVLACIEAGMRLDKYDDTGETLLINAARKGDTAIVKLLIENGAEIDQIHKQHGSTALMFAAQNGHTKTVQALIDLGANINRGSTVNYYTALMFAADGGHTETVQALIDRGANINQGTTNNGTTALMTAADKGHTETIQALIDRGANINQGTTNNGTTALIFAAHNGHTETVQALIDRGANINQGTTEIGITALMVAAQNGHTETVQALIDRGANINQGTTDDGITALMIMLAKFKETDLKAFYNRHKCLLTQNELTQQNHHGRSAIVILSERRDISRPLLQLFMGFAVPKIPPAKSPPIESCTQSGRQECKVCLDRNKNTAFQCGHQTCFECAEKVDKCPICRKPIMQRIKLFD